MDSVLLFGGARDTVHIQSVDNHGKAASISWKNPRVAPGGLVLAKVSDPLNEQPILLVPLEDKPVVQFYQFGRSDPSLQVHLEEILTSLTFCQHKHILLGGSGKGSIFLWDFTTGELLVKWQAHFKAASKLVVTQDGEMLVSGGGDGLVRAWCISSLLSDSGSPQPYR